MQAKHAWLYSNLFQALKREPWIALDFQATSQPIVDRPISQSYLWSNPQISKTTVDINTCAPLL